MKMRWLGRFTAILVSLSPAVVRAADPAAPHDGSFTNGLCSNCHTLYDTSASGSLDFSAGCNACHAGISGSACKFPSATDEAKPGVRGTQHSWSGYAENPAVGAVMPAAEGHQRRLVDGRLQCAVCHTVHQDADPEFNPNSRHTKVSVVAGSAATLTLANPGTKPRGYRIRIQTKNGTTGKFIFTKKGSTANPIWMNWISNRWVMGTETGEGRPYTANTPQVVEDGDDLRLNWSAAGDPGDKWDVLVSYPGLRLSVVDDFLCTYCHKAMSMKSMQVAGDDTNFLPNGSRMFSHPVGEGLGANGLGTDHDEVLGVDGKPQTQSTDGNPTNHLNLVGGVVRCTTCHAIHGADSNSLTAD